MTPPAFWHRPPTRPGGLARMLAPLAAIWTWETRRRLAAGPRERLAVPVICVGNIGVGGAGKTPTAIALLERLSARGVGVHALSRGYGGRLRGPVRVDPSAHNAADVGDEPLLLAAFAPVWVGADRRASARAAIAEGAEALVMDDGFQNPALAPALSLVVVDVARGFGNGRVMPAGPLREPVADGLARADLLVCLGRAEAEARFLADWPSAARTPRLSGALEPLPTGLPLRGRRVIAFAGIARPERFFATLEGLGATLTARHGFSDHAPYPPQLLTRLRADAMAAGAQLVTTEKDAVRLPPRFRREVLTLPVRARFRDEAPLAAALDALFPPVPPR